MKFQLLRSTVSLLVLLLLTGYSPGQEITIRKPRQEQLLNGLDVLIWSRTDTDRITVKLRIHNGSAYDPQGKEGTVALLGDIIFPDDGINLFFREDLDGELEIETTYDYIQITASARSDAFVSLLETIAPAVASPNIDRETTEKVKKKRRELLARLDSDPAHLAEFASINRLYGDFPYGRPLNGTDASLDNIDFADLIFAKERYLTADNATLTIEGNVRSNFAYLATRRLFGGWEKSGNSIPTTFRLPEPPPAEPKLIFTVGERWLREVYAVEGFARKDRDRLALEAATRVANKRLGAIFSGEADRSAAAVNRSYFLKGIFLVSYIEGIGGDTDFMDRSPESVRLFSKIFSEKIMPAEYEEARSAIAARLRKLSPSDFWLDRATYKLKSPDEEVKLLRELTLSATQKAADEIAGRKGVTVVLVSRPAEDPLPAADPKDPSR